MIAELICVGTELLMGQVLNTDAQFISQSLAPLGVDIYHQLVVGDNPARLTRAVHEAFSRADVVIFSGGLGPTDDDLTKETVAAALGRELVLFEDEWEKLQAYFRRTGRAIAPNNRKQAVFPVGAIILPNPNGTAPGCIIEQDGKAAVLLPGPPRELYPMFTDYVMPYLCKKADHMLYSRVVRIYGRGESDVTYQLDRLIKNQTNPTIAPYVKTCEVTLRVTARCKTSKEGEALVLPVVQKIRETLGDVVFDDNDRSLPQVCHDLLTERGQTLAVAESCTGGLLSSAFIDLPGSSRYFVEGAVTYTNEAKMRRLGVSAETLDRFGAVSEPCAKEMAEGMRRIAGADYALATTGVAGPDGGTEETPVGLVYIALATPAGVRVKAMRLRGDRARIRDHAVLEACDILRRNLCTNE